MKVCWDNLHNFKLTVHGNFKRPYDKSTYHERLCASCGDICLTKSPHKEQSFCNHKCKADFFNKRRNYCGENNSFYGKKHSEESKRKMSIMSSGPLAPNWRGGLSCNQYCIQWRDKEYKHWIIYERDGKCFGSECNGKYSNILILHHINYDKKDCRPVNLITLCPSCNSKANFDRKWHEAWYSTLMEKRNFTSENRTVSSGSGRICSSFVADTER